jgi:hypothetical protein
VRFGGEDSECKAVLESEDLLVRGDIRLRIPFRDVHSVGASNGTLCVAWPGGEAELEVGHRAERWADRIRNPRTLADKLGLKPGLRVGVVAVEHEMLAAYGPPEAGSDLIFVGAESRAELERVRELAPLLAPAGGIWVVASKGRPDPSENDVLAAGRAAGLTDVKVAKFSDTHTAHKFVIPQARRPTG